MSKIATQQAEILLPSDMVVFFFPETGQEKVVDFGGSKPLRDLDEVRNLSIHVKIHFWYTKMNKVRKLAMFAEAFEDDSVEDR